MNANVGEEVFHFYDRFFYVRCFDYPLFFSQNHICLSGKKKKSQTQDILVTPILFLRHLLSASSVC